MAGAIIKQDPVYAVAQDTIQRALEEYGAAVHTDPNAPAMRLHPQSVRIEGAPRQNGAVAGEFLMSDYAHGDKRDRLDVTMDFNPAANNDNGNNAAGTDLRAVQEGQLRKAALTALQTLLSKISLKGGGTVADKIDFSGEPPEASKPRKEQVADLKALVEKGITEAGDKLPPEVAALLRHAKTFDAENGSVFGFASTNVAKGHVEVSFAVNKKEEGETSNVALARANIEARKEEILAAVRDAALASHAANPNTTKEGLESFKADLSKLDLQVDMANADYGGNVIVRLGNKVDAPADAAQQASGERLVGKTVLAELSEKTLKDIINDSVLFKGKDADKVAHLLAGDNDVDRLLTRYKDASPAFAEAIKSNVMVNSLSWEDEQNEREKIQRTAKIIPSVTVDTSDGSDGPNNKLRIHLDLPEGITHSEVVRALAGKSIAPAAAASQQDAATPPASPPENPTAPLLTPAGSATDRILQERANAAANDKAPGAGRGAA